MATIASRLCSHFTIIALKGGGESMSCNHCPNYNKVVSKVNATFARGHLTASCEDIDHVTKYRLL